MLLLLKSGDIMRYLLSISLILSIFANPVTCQDNTKASKSAGNLYLNFRNINFVKNNEYSNPIIEGYTLIGYYLQPEIVYLPSDKVALRLGAHFLSYSGLNKFSLIKPLFSISYNFSENSLITIGSLSGSDRHRMFDQHFNKERLYNAYSEDGLQFTTHNDHLFSDTWLSWEKFIFMGDNNREIFTAGESFKYSSTLIGDVLRFEVPVQLQFKHYGGQISNYPEPVETYFNIAGGTRISFDITDTGFGRAGFEYLVFAGNKLAGRSTNGINNGYGQLFKLFSSYKKIILEIGYWKAHNFFAPNGNYIYSCVSDYRDNVTIRDRKIITCSASISIIPENFLELYLGFEGFYDVDLQRFDNSVALHLRFDKLIKLATLK